MTELTQDEWHEHNEKLRTLKEDFVVFYKSVLRCEDTLSLDDDLDYFLSEDEFGNDWDIFDEKEEARQNLKKYNPLAKAAAKRFVDYFAENLAPYMLPCNRVVNLCSWLDYENYIHEGDVHWSGHEIIGWHVCHEGFSSMREKLRISEQTPKEREMVYADFGGLFEEFKRKLTTDIKYKLKFFDTYHPNELSTYSQHPDSDFDRIKFDSKVMSYFKDWVNAQHF